MDSIYIDHFGLFIMKVLVFTAYYLPGYKGGGPIKTIKNLTSNLSSKVSFYILTNDRDLGDLKPYDNICYKDWNSSPDSEIYYLNQTICSYLDILKKIIDTKPDILYLNSLFSIKFSLYPLLLSKILKKKVVLCPRGELSPGALRLKTHKKNIFLFLFRKLRLDSNVIFQASTLYEKKDILNVFGDSIDIQIAENISSQVFSDRIAVSTCVPIKAVFLSRISPKKNLIYCLDVLEKISVEVLFDIYGPIEDSHYWQICLKKIQNLPPNIQVKYQGELAPEVVVPTLTKYDFFLFPTKGENYGHVIVEALCAGLPLVISDATPWRGLRELDLGWDIPLNDQDRFVEAILILSEMALEDRIYMRQKILEWAKKRFQDNKIVQDNLDLFKYANTI